MAAPNQRFIGMAVALLVVVVGAAVAVLYLVPGGPGSSGGDEQLPAAAPKEFNLQVLDRTVYKSLNQTLIQSGQLPVRPPTTAGKANPFL